MTITDVVVLRDEAGRLFFDGPRWLEAAAKSFCTHVPFGRFVPGTPFERARPRLELNALGTVSACVPAATAPGPTRINGGCLTGGGSLGGRGYLRQIFHNFRKRPFVM
jgi:hypothetical protein